MEATNEAILGWTRVAVLLLGMGWAAWMDHRERRVANEHWIVWAKPAIFIWALDLMVQGADWTIYLTAAAVAGLRQRFGVRSPDHQGRPQRFMDGPHVPVLVRSRCSGCGRRCTSLSGHHPVEVLLDNGALGMLWWRTAALFLVIFFIDMAWRLRLPWWELTPRR